MANLKASKTSVNVGVDVGKESLHVYLYEKDIFFEVANNSTGIAKLLKRLTYYDVVRIVMEATGRYEFELAEACYVKKLPVVIARPISIRRYAGAIDQLAKTDKIDAQVIAQYGAVIKPRITPEKSKNLLAIKDLLARRRQLMGMRTQELNRHQIMGKAMASSIARIIKVFDTEIARLEARLQKHVEQQSEWSEKQSLLLTTPGVGDTLVYTLLADLPEIGTLTNREIAKLVGVAPLNRESGKLK